MGPGTTVHHTEGLEALGKLVPVAWGQVPGGGCAQRVQDWQVPSLLPPPHHGGGNRIHFPFPRFLYHPNTDDLGKCPRGPAMQHGPTCPPRATILD